MYLVLCAHSGLSGMCTIIVTKVGSTVLERFEYDISVPVAATKMTRGSRTRIMILYLSTERGCHIFVLCLRSQ